MLATYLNCVKLKLLNNVKINFDINNEDDFEIFKTLRRIVINEKINQDLLTIRYEGKGNFYFRFLLNDKKNIYDSISFKEFIQNHNSFEYRYYHCVRCVRKNNLSFIKKYTDLQILDILKNNPSFICVIIEILNIERGFKFIKYALEHELYKTLNFINCGEKGKIYKYMKFAPYDDYITYLYATIPNLKDCSEANISKILDSDISLYLKEKFSKRISKIKKFENNHFILKKMSKYYFPYNLHKNHIYMSNPEFMINLLNKCNIFNNVDDNTLTEIANGLLTNGYKLDSILRLKNYKNLNYLKICGENKILPNFEYIYTYDVVHKISFYINKFSHDDVISIITKHPHMIWILCANDPIINYDKFFLNDMAYDMKNKEYVTKYLKYINKLYLSNANIIEKIMTNFHIFVYWNEILISYKSKDNKYPLVSDYNKVINLIYKKYQNFEFDPRPFIDTRNIWDGIWTGIRSINLKNEIKKQLKYFTFYNEQ